MLLRFLGSLGAVKALVAREINDFLKNILVEKHSFGCQ